MKNTMTILSAALLMSGMGQMCQTASARSTFDQQFEEYPTYNGEDLELKVDASGTHFRLWSPKAQEVLVNLYNTGLNGKPYETIPMTFHPENGTWTASGAGKL